MTRKHNPLVALAALVILATILVLTCTGCTDTWTPEPGVPAPRFTVETATHNGEAGQHTLIITDTETGVQYLYFKSMNSGGLTPLLPGEE